MGVSVTVLPTPSASDEKASRSTRQKRALAAVLDSSDRFRSAQDLHAELRRRGEHVGLTTVYGQLRVLADVGEVDALRSDDGETRYRRCVKDHHHHHLVCRVCGHTVEVEGPEVESRRFQARVRHPGGTGRRFPWASVGAAHIASVAARSELATDDVWSERGRWFAELRRGEA